MSRIAADDGRLVYVGNLPNDVKEEEIEDIFVKYGRVKSVDLKTPARPPPYAFVEFGDPLDAEDAVRGRDGYDFYGCRLRVELAKGNSNRDRGDRRDRDRGGRDDRRGGGRDRGPPRDFRAPNTGYRVIVKGLPGSASWQDLKDHFRKVVRPAYTNVMRNRDGVVGIVEFENAEDMDRAIRKLDDTEFQNPFDRGYIRLVEDRGHGGGRGGRSRSRSPRGRSRSPRGRGGRSRSRSPRGGRSRSRTRTPPSRGRSPVSRSPSPRGRSRTPRGRAAGGSRSPEGRRSASPMKEEEARGRSGSPAAGGAGGEDRERSPSPAPRDD